MLAVCIYLFIYTGACAGNVAQRCQPFLNPFSTISASFLPVFGPSMPKRYFWSTNVCKRYKRFLQFTTFSIFYLVSVLSGSGLISGHDATRSCFAPNPCFHVGCMFFHSFLLPQTRQVHH